MNRNKIMRKITGILLLCASAFFLKAEVVSTIPEDLLVQSREKLSKNTTNRLVQLERVPFLP